MLGFVLTLDLGNSRTKACLWQRRLVLRTAEFALDDDLGLASFADEIASTVPEDARCLALSSVADSAYTRRVVKLFAERRWNCVIEPHAGLENQTRSPETVGVDRLYAARGALTELGESTLICDLGTALTVDLCLAPAAGDVGSFVGTFAGGAIAVGPQLAAMALAEHTARLPAVELVPGAPALGRDTQEAIRAGCVVGIRGAARALVEEISREAGLPGAPVCVTGGARAFLMEPEPFTERVVLASGELVHRGLLEAALVVLGR